MVFYHIYYRVAFLTAGIVHLYWNDLIDASWDMVVVCLSATAQPLILRLVRLHAMVMMCLVLGVLFNTASAAPDQSILTGGDTSLHVRRCPIVQISPPDNTPV